MNNSNSPAFPVHPETTPNFEEHEYGGLTKREYFAGLAMASLITHGYNPDKYPHLVPKTIAHKSVELADALLLELQKQPTQ